MPVVASAAVIAIVVVAAESAVVAAFHYRISAEMRLDDAKDGSDDDMCSASIADNSSRIYSYSDTSAFDDSSTAADIAAATTWARSVVEIDVDTSYASCSLDLDCCWCSLRFCSSFSAS